MPDIDSKIAEANSKLRAASIRVSIERRGNKLWLRATLPPKPRINKQQPYQQKVSLDVNATPAGLQAAFIKAKAMGLELDSGKFSWDNWIETPEKVEAVSEWLQRFEDDHWQRTKRTDAALTTWKDYRVIFGKLDGDAFGGKQRALTLDALLEVVRATEPDSRTRKKTCTYLYKLGKFAAIDGVEAIKELAGNYSASAVQPRKLPSDKLIAEYRESIKTQSWQWVYGMIAAYGVRSHEAFHLDLEDFPVVRVLRGKTGERFIYPLYPEWAERWSLRDMRLPDIDPSFSNAKLGSKVSGWFYDSKAPFRAYDLRHCYARRCFEFGLAPDWASGLMGHSLQVHLKTYRAWIDEATYRRAYELVINRQGRPLPPQIL
ncbi:MAG: integrase [Desmonostoc geniculatum HA4340-LM1]|nr:integrase [Desmonostoc geniculatum HA4340-LM1]